MKNRFSISVSFVAMALASTSLANVIPPSFIGSGGGGGGVFRRQNITQETEVTVTSTASTFGQVVDGATQSVVTRREPLINSRGILNTRASVTTPHEQKKKGEDNNDDSHDIRHLNLALFLQHFLSAFFERGLSQYADEDFIRAGYPDWVRGRYTQMLEQKRTHRDFLESAVVAAGSDVVRPCGFEFGDNDVRAFIDQSAALATISASALTGSLQNFNNKGYVTAAASILSVEARHAAWINSAVRRENPSNTAFETPLTPNQIATLLSKFINYDSCPTANRDLLPSGYAPHPRLFLAPRLVPGGEVEISFLETGIETGMMREGERLYVAFLAGAETIFARVVERDEEGGGDRSGRGLDENECRGDHEDDGHDDNHYDVNKKNKDDNDNEKSKGRMDENIRKGENNRHNVNNDNDKLKGKQDHSDETIRKADKNRQDDNHPHHGSSTRTSSNGPTNPGSSRVHNRNDNTNNNRRFFVDIPRDLAAKGTVFVIVVKAGDNIGEVRLDEQSTVAGPAIANFPFDAWNKPIGW